MTAPARQPAAAAVDAVGLTKRYDAHTAVDDLTLRIERGEIFGLLGPNGAGKTTTILMLLGLTEPTAGSVRVCGLDPARQALEVKRLVGYLPDDVGFYDQLSGRDNLRYTARLNRMGRDEAEGRIGEVLEQVGLTAAGDTRTRAYSRGMRQRLGLADALLKNPEVLILDEPTVNIDPAGVQELLGLVRRLRDEQGITVLLSSHLLHQVEEVCDRVGMFVAGRLVGCGTIADLVAELDDRWVVEVEADGEPDAVSGVIDGVADDLGAEVFGGPRRWTVRSRTDPRAELSRRLAAAGLPIRHLARVGADLDAVYLRHFGKEAA